MFSRGAAALVILLAVAHTASFGDNTPVNISLRAVVQPRNQIVTVADVARLSGGDLIARRRIAALDVAEFVGDQPPGSISREQIIVRIRIAGIATNEFTVTGAEQVLFRTSNQQSSEARLLEFLRTGIASQLGLDPPAVQVRLTRPLSVNPNELFKPGIRLEHFLPSTIRPGLLNARIGVHEADRLIRTLSASLEVLLAREVYVVKRPIDSGAIVSAEDVALESRVMSGQASKYAASVLGRKTRKAIRPGTILTELDLQRLAPRKKEIVVRARDIVDVVARRRGLQIRIKGAVALQQGAVGDAIRVRNPNSGRNGRVLTAKVVDQGVVEIRL